jgi:hypothetical protein
MKNKKLMSMVAGSSRIQIHNLRMGFRKERSITLMWRWRGRGNRRRFRTGQGMLLRIITQEIRISGENRG